MTLVPAPFLSALVATHEQIQFAPDVLSLKSRARSSSYHCGQPRQDKTQSRERPRREHTYEEERQRGWELDIHCVKDEICNFKS